MKTLSRFICLLFLAMPLAAHAQSDVLGLGKLIGGAKQVVPNTSLPLKQWVDAIESGDVQKVVDLYSPDAVMLSAFAIDPITTQKGLLDYYKKVVKEPHIRITVTKQDPRVLGNVLVNVGLYRFQWTQDGEPMDVPARFTFVYARKGSGWSIVSHHSSKVPGAK